MQYCMTCETRVNSASKAKSKRITTTIFHEVTTQIFRKTCNSAKNNNYTCNLNYYTI